MRLIDADRMKEELLWGNVFLPAIQTNTLVDLIDNQPTIDPESLRPTSQLVQDTCGAIKCKNCGFCVAIGGKNALHNAKREFRFCPNCGAKMEMEEE